MKKILLTAALVLAASSAFAGITNSKHDFSATGGSNGYTSAAAGTQICVYCHTPHNAKQSALLWNRGPAAAVTVYDKSVSGTLNFSAITTIGTTSTLCLSCHDGSIAVDSFGSNTGSKPIGATNSANLGSNLTNDHPIGFSYASTSTDTDIVPIATGTVGTGKLPLFVNTAMTDSMECATCHDVHGKLGNAKFLRIDNSGSNLCKNCHLK